MREKPVSERSPRANARRGVLCAQSLRLTPAQARALACLIQAQIDAYAEATGGGVPEEPVPPLTGRDLDLLEPLLGPLRGMPDGVAGKTFACIRRPRHPQ